MKSKKTKKSIENQNFHEKKENRMDNSLLKKKQNIDINRKP